MFPHLIEAFRHQCRVQPDAVALIVPDGDATASFNWRQLQQIVATFASDLRQRVEGQFAEQGQPVVAHPSDNTLADVVVALSCIAIGAIEVPIDHRLGDEEVDQLRGQVGGLWLSKAERSASLAKARRSSESDADCSETLFETKIDPDAPSLILWTSGTTGTPRGVVLSQRSLTQNAAAKLAAVPESAADVRLCSLPLCHAYARTCDMGTWLLSGCTLALTLGYAGWQRLGPHVRPTIANTVPSLARRLFESATETTGSSRLRLLGCGGAAISESAFNGWKQRGVTVIQGYGLTETSPVICSASPENATAGLVGPFVDGWDHETRDGRLFVRGPAMMLGYWNDGKATAHKIIDGWLDTGDLVETDAATGQVRILGRADEVIVLDSGRKIHPLGIEKGLCEIDGVDHAMLHYQDGKLQLWLDAIGEVNAADLEKLFQSKPHWQRPAMIHTFSPRLSRAAGELTSKGTLRRKQIMANRKR